MNRAFVECKRPVSGSGKRRIVSERRFPLVLRCGQGAKRSEAQRAHRWLQPLNSQRLWTTAGVKARGARRRASWRASVAARTRRLDTRSRALALADHQREARMMWQMKTIR